MCGILFSNDPNINKKETLDNEITRKRIININEKINLFDGVIKSL